MSRNYDNFADLITFSRASQSTVVDSDGTLKYAAHNLETRSDDFVNWGSSEGSVTANQIAAPDGTITADLFVESTSSLSSRTLNGSASHVANTKYFIVVYIKNYSSDRYVQLSGFGLTANGQAPVFDPVNGTVDTNLGSRCLSASITDVGNGWYKCVAEVISTSSSNFYINIGKSATNNFSQSYTGNGTSGVYLWGAHVYRADKPMQNNPAQSDANLATYVPTTDAAVYQPRIDFDAVTGDRKGLLIEEARTNLITESEVLDIDSSDYSGNNLSDTLQDGTLAPDGVTQAYFSLESDALTSQERRLEVDNFVPTVSTTYTLSVFARVKSGHVRRLGFRGFGAGSQGVYPVFDLVNGTVVNAGSSWSNTQIEDYGDGWYRCSSTVATASVNSPLLHILAADADGSGTFYVGDTEGGLYFWGLQVEQASFPTSYIPTSGSTATRSVDIAQILLSAFGFSSQEGTLFAEASSFDTGQSYSRIFAINNNSSTHNTLSLILNEDKFRAFVSEGAVYSVNLIVGDISDNTFFKGAMGYETNNVAASVNGQSVVSDTSATMPDSANLTTITIGSFSQGGAFNINGHIKKLQYFPRRLSDTELQEITS